MKNFTLSTEVFERYLDASVELFMECYAETITIDSDAAAQKQDSPRLNEKCKALIKANHRRKKLVSFIKGSKRVLKSAAVLAIAFLSLGSFLFITVEAVRTPILNFYIQKNDGNWELSNIPFASDTNDPKYHAPEGSFNEQNPLEYILSNEFTLSHIDGNLNDSLMAIYNNSENQTIVFECRNADTSTRVNSDDAEVTRLTVSGYDAVISTQDDRNSVLLVCYNSDLNRTFSLQSDCLTQDELISIAESLNFVLMF